jgi:hypothetical protein
MSARRWPWLRERRLALVVAVVLGACGPPYAVRRSIHDEVDADDGQGGPGGEGGQAGEGGGTGGAPRVDASGGIGGEGGRKSPPDTAVDSAPDMAADRGTDLPADLGPEAGGTKKTVLMVMGFIPPMMKPGDTRLKARLEARGFTVKIGDDDDADASKAMGTDLVIISDTCGPQVMAKYTTLAEPVICAKNSLLDDLKMTGNTATDRGMASATQLTISDTANPLAAGLTSPATINTAATAATWGKPSAAAQKVATIPGLPDEVAIFAYPSGAMMNNNFVAPAKRIALFVSEPMAMTMNDNGLKLFDAAVDWALQ